MLKLKFKVGKKKVKMCDNLTFYFTGNYKSVHSFPSKLKTMQQNSRFEHRYENKFFETTSGCCLFEAELYLEYGLLKMRCQDSIFIFYSITNLAVFQSKMHPLPSGDFGLDPWLCRNAFRAVAW